MKNIFMIFLIFAIALPLKAFVSKQQDKNNIAYLDELDEYIIDTIDLLSTFNQTANAMAPSIAGAQDFSKYLMDLTLECSMMRQIIDESLSLNASERDFAIRAVLDFIKPDKIVLPDFVDNNTDQKNRRELNHLFPVYEDKLNRLRSALLKEENRIIEMKAITPHYLALHNKHFIYHLMYYFIKDHHYLSAPNRQYLLNLVVSVENGIEKSQY